MGSFIIHSPKYGKQKVLFDDEDFDIVDSYNWHLHVNNSGNFYVQARVPFCKAPSKIKMHNLLSGYNFVDHINGNGLDNRRNNLRKANHQSNAWNRKRPSKKNKSSKYKGVFFNNRKGLRNKWTARIYFNNKTIYLGQFPTEELANKAYLKASKEYFGEFSTSYKESVG